MPRGFCVVIGPIFIMRWIRQIVNPQCFTVNYLGQQMIPGRKQISIELVVRPKDTVKPWVEIRRILYFDPTDNLYD